MYELYGLFIWYDYSVVWFILLWNDESCYNAKETCVDIYDANVIDVYKILWYMSLTYKTKAYML